MRILSQENLPLRDLPYENVTVYTDDDRKEVRALFGNVVYVIAKYSTEAKERKAMEMLRNAYSPKIEIKEPIQKEMPKPRSGDWFWSVTEPKVEVLDNFYFQFPPDDEVEV